MGFETGQVVRCSLPRDHSALANFGTWQFQRLQNCDFPFHVLNVFAKIFFQMNMSNVLILSVPHLCPILELVWGNPLRDV